MVGEHAKKEVIELKRQRKLLVNLMQFKGKKNKTMINIFCSRGDKYNSAKIPGEKLHNIQHREKKTLLTRNQSQGAPLKVAENLEIFAPLSTHGEYISPTTIHIIMK